MLKTKQRNGDASEALSATTADERTLRYVSLRSHPPIKRMKPMLA